MANTSLRLPDRLTWSEVIELRVSMDQALQDGRVDTDTYDREMRILDHMQTAAFDDIMRHRGGDDGVEEHEERKRRRIAEANEY